MQRRNFLKGTAGLVALSTIGSARLALAQGATMKVGVPIPMSGPGGMFGTPCRNVAEMALAEINARGGIAGRPLELFYIDAGTAPAEVAQAALRAWQGDGVEAFVGFHDSGVRGALNSVFQGQVPYVYCSLYEGGECSNGIVVMGETPTQQLQPVVPWLASELGVSKWYLIGNDYNWPRDTFSKAKDFIAAAGGTVVGEEYVPFTVDNFDSSIARIRESGADMVLMTLVGGSAVAFNRAFGSFGLGATVKRSSPGIEELTLAGIGAENSENLYVSAGYFNTVQTDGARNFVAAYAAAHGSVGDLSFLSESVYEGMLALEAVGNRAGSVAIADFEAAVEGTTFTTPRGQIVLNGRHATQDIYLAKANGVDLEIVQTFAQVSAGDNCAG